MTDKNIYLHVPYESKEYVKQRGGRFDAVKKQWYIVKGNPYEKALVKKYSKTIQKIEILEDDRVYFAIKFGDHQGFKSMGGKFDSEKRLWYCHKDNKDIIKKYEESDE
jgi:hypothetical protein